MILGNKVGLRAVETEDLPILRDWRNIEGFRKNFREVRELNLHNQQKWFENVNTNPNDFMFVIEDLSSNQPIGAAGLLYVNWIARFADFSFYIGKDTAYIDDQGLALDAANTLLRYGFNNLNLNKVWMELYEYDQQKIKFFTKELGFHLDGRLRQNCFEGGRYWDSVIVSMLQTEFAKTKDL